MTARRCIGLLALSLGACSTQPTVGSRFNGPTAAVAFRGFSRKEAAIRDYLALTSSRGDELRLLDPADLQPVLGPGAVFPLSIPTAPRPLLLASAALGDLDAGGNPLADALVAASAGGALSDVAGAAVPSGPALQLIETWNATNRVAQPVPLGLAAGTDILCLAGMPARAASDALPAANARILVGASNGLNGQLVVVEFTRAQDGSGAVVPGTPRVKPLGFDPADIAVGPDAAIYIATRDPIATDPGTGAAVFGVARVDASGDIVSGDVTALAAGPKDPDGARVGAGTVAVAALNVPERTVNSNDPSSPDRLVPSLPSKPLVYAALDPAFCGNDKPTNCGIVTIDPAGAITPDAGSLAADPAAADPAALTPDSGPAATRASAQAYRAPMPIPGIPLRIAIGGPPARGFQRITADPLSPDVSLLTLAPGTGTRNTGAVAMVTSSDGRVYWLDLSRWGPPSDLSVTTGNSRVAVASVTPAPAVAAGSYQLGLWQDVAPFVSTPFVPAVRVDGPGLVEAIDVWPGFTDADTWTLASQGALPSLSSRRGLLATSAGTTYAAIQTGTGSTAVVATAIADPSLGVQPGDIVELPSVCEAKVAAVLPPGSGVDGFTFPGGAVRLDPPGSPGVTCTAAQLPAAGASSFATITVRASGLVLSNQKLGYLGRPPISRTETPPESDFFSVAWTSAADGPASPPSETRAVARKARRLFYPSDGPCPIPGATAGSEGALVSGCYGTGMKRLEDPLAPGPIIRFRVGLGTNPSDPAAVPPRDASIVFTTQAGLSQVFRKAVTGGVRAAAAVLVDRTALDPAGKPKAQFAGHENDPIFFFVPYLDDQVTVFSPSQSSAQVASIR